jgi:hypothetical protein
MTITNADGTVLSETQLNALTSDPPDTVVMRVIDEDIHQRFSFDNAGFEQGERLLFRAGQTVSQATIDALFADATVTSVSPATGPAAGGTDITITGTNFAGATAVALGGVAATLVVVVDETTITCRTGAHAAGAVNVVVTDDSGAKTLTNGYTYV